MPNIPMSFLTIPGDTVNPLIDGAVRAEGIDLAITRTDPSTGYWRQLKFEEFDVSVMSLTSYIIGRSRDLDAIALPVFGTRRFMHVDLSYHADSGIQTARDIAGKRIGVGEYQQTAAVWLRGVLEHDFGVSQYGVDWYMERSEELSHGGATGFKPPEGIKFHQIPNDKSLASMLVNHEIDVAGVGRASEAGSNPIDRSTTIRAEGADWSKVKPLFPDRIEEGARFFAKYGYVPATQVYIIRGDIYREHPWAAFNLFDAFARAKAAARASLNDRVPSMLIFGREYAAQTRRLFGNDPFPYGVGANREMLETIVMFCREQGLISEEPKIEDLFAPSTVDL
jgi:4,5-dihydroxyphthalate decarboxylase